MNNFMTPLEVQLGLGLALLIGLAIGWVARGWGEATSANARIERSRRLGCGAAKTAERRAPPFDQRGCRIKSLSTRVSARRERPFQCDAGASPAATTDQGGLLPR